MNEPTLGSLEEPPSAGTAVWVREQESETFARAVATGIAVKGFVGELGFPSELPLPIACDNNGAVLQGTSDASFTAVAVMFPQGNLKLTVPKEEPFKTR